MKPLEVMIVEDQHLLREGLKAMLEADGSVSVVSLAGSAEEALDVLLTSSCEVILMDITLPQRDGVWCIRSIRERGSQIMRAHCERAAPDPAALCSDVPAACSAITEKALEKEPSDRYGSAEEMLTDLWAALR